MHNKDISHIDDEDYNNYDDNYGDDSRYKAPNMSRIEKTSFTTELPAEMEETQNLRLVRSYMQKLFKHLQVDTENMNLVDTNLFKLL